jgi:ABC-type transport system substrate-binding protein
VAAKDVPDLRKASGVKVTSYPSAHGWWLGMTWSKAPFNNMHFRRAMAWAIPYDTLLQVVAQGLAERLRSCMPSNISGYVEDFWPYKTNLEMAQEELAQAQVPAGFTVAMPVYMRATSSMKKQPCWSRKAWRNWASSSLSRNAHQAKTLPYYQETGRYGDL